MIPPLTVVRSLAFSPTVNFLVLINRSTGDLGYDELRVADYTAALKPLAPQMSLRRSTGAGACTLTLQGEAGRWYLVLASSNLTMWVEVTNFTNASDTKEITEPVPVGSQRFYRAIAR